MNGSIKPFDRRQLGLLRVAVVSPELRVADVEFNVQTMVQALHELSAQQVQLAVFPELSITGYTCADLFYQESLLRHAQQALQTLAAATQSTQIATVVGLPFALDGRIFNCAAFLHNGRILGLLPKCYLPSSMEYYEQRWFAPAALATSRGVSIEGQEVPFGIDLLFDATDLPGCLIGVEICEDLWAVEPPSGKQALAGATLLLNPSASDDLLTKADYRRELVRSQSARCLAAYLYAGAGPGESTTDVVFGGHSMIAENGSLLAETERFRFETQLAIADIDLQRLAHERWTNTSFRAAGRPSEFRRIAFEFTEKETGRQEDKKTVEQSNSGTVAVSTEIRNLYRFVPRAPFVPSDLAQRAKHAQEIFAIQATGLMKRLRHTGSKTVSIGISGGLDSTLALLVTVKAFDRLKLDRKGITAITMPGFGTTDRTYENALELMRMLGVTLREIPIRDAVIQHFKDINHDINRHDVTYENSQARERTQILMDVANQIGGFTVGTGDLSELALGWCTFNGDHMSMYHVNAGVPKTLVRYLIEWCAEAEFSGPEADVLHDICATPITPELLPLDKAGQLQQKTEDTVGPYLLHDFFLFYVVRYGFSPLKVFFLAQQAFADEYDQATILKWLKVFYSRFFANQFKRSAMPDGPKVGSVALSPRGDWRMPSDASAALWKRELDTII
ncbi:MAG: NAD(+) synthase [Caldilineaceae bacterium]